MASAGADAIETITVQGVPPTAQSHLWAGEGFSFHDLLDTINPLQHIPVVASLYRQLTGDTIGNVARVAGDGIYGGVLGLIAGLLDVSVTENTGSDIGAHVLAAFTSDVTKPNEADGPAPETQAAATSPPTDVPPPAAATDPAKAVVVPPPATSTAASGTVASLVPLAPAQPKLMPLSTPARSFAIDTSPEGILALRAAANNGPRPVPLAVPSGTLAANQRIPLTGAEFAQRMQDGLDKYKAMMVARNAADAATTVDQRQ